MENGVAEASELPRRLLITHDHETKYEITHIVVSKAGTIVTTVGINISLQ